MSLNISAYVPTDTIGSNTVGIQECTQWCIQECTTQVSNLNAYLKAACILVIALLMLLVWAVFLRKK